MPGPNDYPIWIRQSDNAQVCLHECGTTNNQNNAASFYAAAISAAGQASTYSGALYVKDVSGECFQFFALQGAAPTTWVCVQSSSSTIGINASVCSTSSGNSNDQYFYHWKKHTTCGTNPFEETVTTYDSAATTSDKRQGSYDFYDMMGQPAGGEFVVYDGVCWEFMDYSADISNSGLVIYNQTAPTTQITTSHANCTACMSHLPAATTYHAWTTCTGFSTIHHGIDGDVSGTLTTPANDSVYAGMGSPSFGQCTTYNGICFKYMGQYAIGDAALGGGPYYWYPQTLHAYEYPGGVYHADCAACLGSFNSSVFHTWKKCTNSTVLNIVGPGMPDDSPSSIAFYQSVGSPDVGDIINMDPTGTPGDMCYEYMGETSTAEPGTDIVTIGSYQTFPATSTDPCNDCLNPPVLGCTNPTANNYDPTATVDDGSCTFTYGCTDSAASNYNPLATYDDGSCIYCTYGCTDPNASNYDSNATCDDGSCITTIGGTGGCDIAFGPELCQPDGTSTIEIDLSSGQGLSNVLTTVDGIAYGLATSPAAGCSTPPATIPVTGLTQGQTIKVIGECSYSKEDFDRSAGGSEPSWAIPSCGESEQPISIDTKVYVFYDGTSMGDAKAEQAYKSVMKWLIDLPDFTVNTTAGDPNENVFHVAVAGERWLDWATAPMTGKFNNNQTPQTLSFVWSGSGSNSGTTQTVNHSHCTAGSDCFQKRDSSTNLVGLCQYCEPFNTSRMIEISNWSYNTPSVTHQGTTITVDQFYDTAEGTLVNSPMVAHGTNNQNASQVYKGFPPTTTDDTLVIIFADESSFVYHGENSATPSTFNSPTSQSSSNTTWSGIDTDQPTVAWKDDYTEYISKRTAFTAGGKSYKAFLYPACPGTTTCSCGASHKPFPLHALAAIHSGNQTTPDGTWQTGTTPDNACHSSSTPLSALETSNPYWDNTTPTWGGLDQHGFGVNVAETPFEDQTFIDDLTVFLGSGGSQTICDESQCLIIKAVDVNGSPVMNYPIRVDGVPIGSTNATGTVTHTLSGSGTAVINDCFTFTAVGSCVQSLITIEISEAQITTALNCILGCTDPLSWNYNPLAGIDDGSCMYPLEEDPRDSMSRCELLKIDTECNFATDVYNLYKNKRYGLDPGCLYNMDGRASKKYSSDWVDRLLPDYGAETMTKTKHTKGATPKPDWVDADCGTSTGSCDGSECIVVVVEDKDGNRIPDYEIVLDGLYAGKTDSLGVLRLSIPNAEEDKEHKINLCHCFTTTGNCNSQRIKLTVDGLNCDDCGNIKMF